MKLYRNEEERSMKNPIAIVGLNETCERIRAFYGPTALTDAEEYVDTLPHREDGIYYIDYPCSPNIVKEPMSELQIRSLRLVVETHGSTKVNMNVAKALERRGYVTLPKHSPNVPRITEAGIEYLTGGAQ